MSNAYKNPISKLAAVLGHLVIGYYLGYLGQLE
jgi:hypothetical protein